MDNKTFGITFSAILSSALLVFGAANAGGYAVDQWIFPTQTYGERTYIGTTDVSNMEIVSAKNLFSGQVASWRESTELIVTYQDETANYPLESAEILLDETVHQAESGSKNGFVYQLSSTTTRAFLEQHFPTAVFSDTDVQAVNEKLERALGAGHLETRVSISDDSLMVPKEIVAEVLFPHTLQTAGAEQVIAGLNGFQLPPETQFSFIDMVEQIAPTDATDAELTEIASALYGLVIRTNLLVDERSIGASIPTSTPVGQEASINRRLGIDFKFTNPNASSFVLQLDAENNSLYASLTGMPLVYTYEIQSGAEQWVAPRLIKQYSAFVSYGSMVEEEGREGVRLQVTRTVNADNLEVAVEPVSTDFYPPVHRVEVFALTSTPTETSTDDTGNNVDENGNPVDPYNPTLPYDPANPYNPATPYDPANPYNPTIPYDPSNPANPAIPGNSGNGQPNPNTDPNVEKEPIYDKGGNEVNP